MSGAAEVFVSQCVQCSLQNCGKHRQGIGQCLMVGSSQALFQGKVIALLPAVAVPDDL